MQGGVTLLVWSGVLRGQMGWLFAEVSRLEAKHASTRHVRKVISAKPHQIYPHLTSWDRKTQGYCLESLHMHLLLSLYMRLYLKHNGCLDSDEG